MKRSDSDPDPMSILIAREAGSMTIRSSIPKALHLLLFMIAVALQYLALSKVSPRAQVSSPALTVMSTHNPATFLRGDTGDAYSLTVTNTGGAPTSGLVTLTDTLPLGVKVRLAASSGLNCPDTAELLAGASLVCTTNVPMAPGDAQSVQLLVATATDAPDTVANVVTASGGGAPGATFTDTAPVVDRPVFDVRNFSARALDGSGDDYTVAGGHPAEATTQFAFPTYARDLSGVQRSYPVEDVKDVFT
jgi:uncharacterized repeat protein (TIGR01451 family)